jgi:hypothetical protein
MSINTILPTDLARHRQNVNPAKAKLPSSHGIARQKVDQLKDLAFLDLLNDDFAHCKDIH